MEEQKKMPALRFSEFNREWENMKLGELGRFIGGGTPSTQNREFWNGSIPWISSSDIAEGNIYEINSTRYITADAISQSATKIVPQKSILIVSRVGVGKVAINNVELCTSQDFTNFVPHSSDYVFLAYLIKLKTNSLLGFNQGTSIKGFVKSDLETLEISIPSLPEQQKIASFLTSVDTRLTQLKQKKNLLEQYKKGVMQKIFSREIRFKDDEGKEFPEWEEKKMGQVAEITMGQSPDSKSYNTDGIGKYLIQGNADIAYRKSNPRNWTSEPTKVCAVGDLILTVRAPVGAVAKSIHNACIGRGVCSITNNSNSIIEYLYQFLLDYENKWANIEQGSTFTAVNGADIRSIKINLPCVKEQIKIANFLSSLDEKINHCSTQIEKTEQWKKGLLQKMFV